GTNTLVGVDPVEILQGANAALEEIPGSGSVPELWDGLAAQRLVTVLQDHL
ncbi:MAG TPA: UDP-N-acetylglucosamine 2-epimerase (non-hydrolyzing), partial [Candidatus Latescibacteria bacterium]|nr:UDP-N-acetylglucosamine 2-epimerase (non-hydrolyzing) [Candidatus Latescibacterota bacterium]